MHPDDFYSDKSNSASRELPSKIDTLDDAIAYLQMARHTKGGDVKFRLVDDSYTHDSGHYREVSDVVLKTTGGSRFLMSKSRRDDDEDYVLFAYE